MAAASYSSDVRRIDEAIQRLPPELREIICKEFVSIKLREREVLGWNKVHEVILKKPFCKYRNQIVSTIICVDALDCPYEGCCYLCLIDVKKGPRYHKVSLNPMETIPNIERMINYNGFFANML